MAPEKVIVNAFGNSQSNQDKSYLFEEKTSTEGEKLYVARLDGIEIPQGYAFYEPMSVKEANQISHKLYEISLKYTISFIGLKDDDSTIKIFISPLAHPNDGNYYEELPKISMQDWLKKQTPNAFN